MPCVLIIGTLSTGYTAHGPFPDIEAAQDHYYGHEGQVGYRGDWHILELDPVTAA